MIDKILNTRYILLGRDPEGNVISAGFDDMKDLNEVIEKSKMTEVECFEKEDWIPSN